MRTALLIILLLCPAASPVLAQTLITASYPGDNPYELHPAQAGAGLLRFQFVELDTEVLKSSAAVGEGGPPISLNLFEDINLMSYFAFGDQPADSVSTWAGTVPGDYVQGDAIFAVDDSKLVGWIHADGRLFTIMPTDDGRHVVAEHSSQIPSSLTICKPNDVELPPEVATTPPLSQTALIDVTVVISEPYAFWQVHVYSELAKLTHAFKKDGMMVVFRPRFALEVVHADDPDIEAELSWLEATWSSPNRRDTADLVLYISVVNDGPWGGLASAGTNGTSKPELAFAVVNLEWMKHGAFTHEIGHLLGAEHEGLKLTPDINVRFDANAASHVVPTLPPKQMAYGTITSTATACRETVACHRALVWANPGIVNATITENEGRSVAIMASEVARYR